MNPRIFVVVAVALFAAILGVVAFSGQSIINDTSEEGFLSLPIDASREVLPLTIELEDLTVLEVTDKFATLQIKFKGNSIFSSAYHGAQIEKCLSIDFPFWSITC